jgi:hypothetical protein
VETFRWLIEFSKLIFILFIIMLAYTLINAFLLEAAGGFEVLSESGYATIFFLLQTGGILALMTVYYRNRLQPHSRVKLLAQEPLSKAWTRRLSAAGIAAIAASYVILLLLALG